MIQINDKIISSEIFRVKFICYPEKCFGACCIYGDSGAPLEEEETTILEKEFGKLVQFISPEGLISINKQGKWVIDDDGESATPLIDGHECAYAVFENGTARCAIEIAYNKGSVNFLKPRSCHLYPIRVSKTGESIALNFHKWHICDAARERGEKENMPVFRFLKDAITRVWGDKFYNELEEVYAQMIAEGSLPDR